MTPVQAYEQVEAALERIKLRCGVEMDYGSGSDAVQNGYILAKEALALLPTLKPVERQDAQQPVERADAFARDKARYHKEWSDPECPLTQPEDDAYMAGWFDGFSEGYNRGLEVEPIQREVVDRKKVIEATINEWLDCMGVNVGGKYNDEKVSRDFLARNIEHALSQIEGEQPHAVLTAKNPAP